MFKSIADNRNPNSLASQFRRRRFEFFLSLMSQLELPVTILDVGGTEDYWRLVGFDLNEDIKITLLNLTDRDVSNSNIDSVVGDGRNLQYPNKSFDVIFSNSVIEHVGNFEDQFRMAEEIRRVGKRYFVQTPNRYFFIEPHFLFPYFQFLPIRLRMWLVMSFKLGWFKKEPSPKRAQRLVESITLLKKSELLALFPDCKIYQEKIFGMTKSFIAYSGWD